MAKIGIFYGSTTGVCEDVANKIAEQLGDADVYNIAGNEDKLGDYDVLILGTSTWGFGELQADWIDSVDALGSLDLNGKKVAYFGTGDQSSFSDTFIDGIALLNDEIEKTVIEKVVKPVLEKYNLSSENIKYYINPTGRFVIGGPHGDTGLTGRKIIVDTYGGYFRHGGGAFSGKDPSKVDRSAAYAARWVAKNIVAAGLADKCEIQLSYAIGVPKPVSIKVDTFGTSKVDEDKISEAVSKVFDLSPRGIEKALELREGKFKYQDLAAFGHIGRTDIDTPWERLNKVDELKKSIN